MYKFFGHHPFLLDEKGRVNIPSQFRKALKPEDQDTFVMTRGPGGCVYAFPFTAWGYYVDVMRDVKIGSTEKLKMMRSILSYAAACPFDKQGRVRIPPKLIELARLEREVTIVGFQDRIEIWNTSIFESATVTTNEEYDNLATPFFIDMMPRNNKPSGGIEDLIDD